MSENNLLLEVKDVKVQFEVRGGTVSAVDGISYNVKRGQTLGVIGESGSGKSVTARAIMGMVPKPGRVAQGEILFHMRHPVSGNDETVNMVKLDPDGDRIRKIRGGHIGMIFQEPMSSLTPVYSAGFHIGEALDLHLTPGRKIGAQMSEAIQAHQKVSKAEAREVAIDMLHKVGLPKPGERVDSFPHQLSGGQRQRVMIAIALSCQPELLIADEPTTALDVSIEAQILDLMRDLQREFGMAIIFITHNLGVVAEMADEIVVMYMGKEVERATTVELFENPYHPYTQALMRSIPRIGAKKEKLYAIKGMVPDPLQLPKGCVFHPRCPHMMPGKCDVVTPINNEITPGHPARCLLFDQSWPQTSEAQAIKEKDGGIPNRLPEVEV